MSYLVDTNVLCEPLRKLPDPVVVSWLRQNERELYVSAITIGKIRRGIEILSRRKRQLELRRWLDALCNSTKGRILGFNTSTTHVWGQLKAKCDREGRNISSIDSQIAATALRYKLTVVTRNTKDFEPSGVDILNPFRK